MGNVVVTISNEFPLQYEGELKMVFGTLHLSTSYATGGDAFTNSMFGLERIAYIDISSTNLGNANGNSNTSTWNLVVNYPATSNFAGTGTIQAFGTAAGQGAHAEASSTTDLHTFIAAYIAIGW